jgi:osmotically-inducible protein OsmY
MSTRYGDRDPRASDDSDEERYDAREADRYSNRGFGNYGGRRERAAGYGSSERDASEGRDYDYGRDYGYGRDYDSRDYGTRESSQRAGRSGILGGYEGPPSRAYDRENYGRYDREEYGRGYDKGEYGREARRDYSGESGRADDYTREDRGDRVRSFDTDYGRTTSRFYGRSGYVYGRDDYDRPVYGPEVEEFRRSVGHGGRGERNWLDRAADEVRSWFGDGEAGQRRRNYDAHEGRGTGKFRGRGPKNYRRSDERIREEINDRMTENEWLDASDVETVVLNGEVTLTGSVDSRYAKRLAEDIADSVAGVTNVQNNLRVLSQDAGSTGMAGAAAATAGLPTATSAATDATLTSDAPDAGTTDRASKAAGRG